MQARSSVWLERFLDTEEVDGSSPFGPTTQNGTNQLRAQEARFRHPGNDGHSRFLDPHFVDATKDFHLRSDSPALAAGTTDGVPVGELDLEGSPRVTSGRVDIGCYQRQRE